MQSLHESFLQGVFNSANTNGICQEYVSGVIKSNPIPSGVALIKYQLGVGMLGDDQVRLNGTKDYLRQFGVSFVFRRRGELSCIYSEGKTGKEYYDSGNDY